MTAEKAQEGPFKFGPWTAGLVNSVDDLSIPTNGLAVAENIDIGRDGVITTRHLWELQDANNYSSIFPHNRITYAVRNREVGIVGDSLFTSIATVDSSLAWCVLDGDPIYTDYNTIRMISGGVSEALPNGYFEGDEEREYQLSELPGGTGIYHWMGRLLVVRGNSLLWSESMRYGVYSSARNKIRFDERVQWAAPINGGIYVGLRNTVVFFAGNDPAKFQSRIVGGKSAPGVSGILDPKRSGVGGEQMALWFTEVGIAIGRGSGEVSYPQADRLKNLTLSPGKMVVEDDRVYIFTTSE